MIFLLSNFIVSAADSALIADSLRANAQKGDVFSQIKLGEEFLYGVNRTRNLNLAFYYFNMAATQNSEIGYFYLGFCTEYGYGTTCNPILAYQYYEKAIALDEAKFKIALMLEKGIRGGKFDRKYYKSVEQNKTKSRELIDLLVQKKYPPAMVKKGEELFFSKEITPESGMYIFELFSEAAELNDVQAKKYLVDCYLMGIGTKQDEDKAFKLAEELYNSKNSGIASKLGRFYEFGIGVMPDMAKAIKLYTEAAAEGDSVAKVKIAEQYLSGFYLPTDLQKALEILHSEMKNNNPDAIKLLGDCFMKGVGIDKDEKQAFNFYLRAATLGNIEAQYELAKCFRNGRGTPIDEGAVFFWLKQASAAGKIDCMRELAECYINGYGTKQDLKFAEKLLLECAKKGDKKADLILKEVF